MRLDLPCRLTKKEATQLVGELVTRMDASEIEPGTVVHDAESGAPVLAYMPLHDPGPLRRALLSIEYPDHGVRRYNNYRTRSRVFGYRPARPMMQREDCGRTSLYSASPGAAAVVETYADQFAQTLKAILPDTVERDRAVLGGVLPEWRLGTEKLWTSGVINDTAQLPYHRDGFNFPTWSVMPVVRRGVRGGYLHIPEYGLVLPCADGTVVMFEGFRWVHGVTPISRIKKGEGYRISVVYYALRGMKNCREAAEETAAGRRKRTERERAMAARLSSGDRSIPGHKVK